MAKKSSGPELPKWATGLWKELGSPDLDSIQGIHSGDPVSYTHLTLPTKA